jgi:acyl CoA:acetate/3-ketoacid CoA transferase alpha subunit
MHVGIQIDADVRSAAEGRYGVLITVFTRDTADGNLAARIPTSVPSIPIFHNFTFAGTLILANGETAQISGYDTIRNENLRADITLSLKR